MIISTELSRFAILGIVLLLLLPMTATAAENAPPALSGLDPVLLSRGDEVAGDEQYEDSYEGFVYRFASEETLAEFRANPQRWSIQLGGRCAAMTAGQGDPSIFSVHEERIYIFGGPQCRAHFLKDPGAYLKDKMRVAILVYDGVELLDFAGPGEVFAVAGHGLFEVYTVAPSSESVRSQGFVTIVPEYSIDSAPMPDILVVPGGSIKPIWNDSRVHDWIAHVAKNGDHIVSVCNGALLLARIGLLDGLSATTHYGSIASLREYEGIDVREDDRFVDNGRIITSAGVSAGIDGALHLVERILGHDTALEAAKYMEYNWLPADVR